MTDRKQVPHPDTAEALNVLEAALSAERRTWISRLVTGTTPMEKWERHTDVSTIADLQTWAERQLREVLVMRLHRDAKNDGAPTEDELGDYLVGKSGALSMVLANIRQIREREAREIARVALEKKENSNAK